MNVNTPPELSVMRTTGCGGGTCGPPPYNLHRIGTSLPAKLRPLTAAPETCVSNRPDSRPRASACDAVIRRVRT
eukprot:scaffold60841_cov59-Phaeocystis_antarctica.AAC.4